MKLQVLAGVFLALAAGEVYAEAVNATCKNGTIVRRVELAPGESPGGCSVAYFKETENPGVTQVLWSAKSGTDFCKEKAEGFVQKLSGMGWSCTGSLAGSSSDATTEAPAGASAP
jgi:hypothetical protein